MNILFRLLPVLIIAACNSISEPKFSNNGVVTVLNGRNEVDSLSYKCDSCYEILKDKKVFDTLISIATSDAKAVLRNKLSFLPISVDLKVIPQDSLYYTSGEKIDSLVTVIANYKCIGKNGYGVEDEVESTSLIYLVNNKVVNLEGKIKMDTLSLQGDGVVSRNLTVYTDDGKITIQPVKIRGDVHLIAVTDESCVEDARLKITFTDNEEMSMTSWNKFNCDNNSYFKITPAQLKSLESKPISFISFAEDDFLFCSVPENEKDYFIQFVKLVK